MRQLHGWSSAVYTLSSALLITVLIILIIYCKLHAGGAGRILHHHRRTACTSTSCCSRASYCCCCWLHKTISASYDDSQLTEYVLCLYTRLALLYSSAVSYSLSVCDWHSSSSIALYQLHIINIKYRNIYSFNSKLTNHNLNK